MGVALVQMKIGAGLTTCHRYNKIRFCRTHKINWLMNLT